MSLITKSFARIEDGKLRMEAEVIPAILQDDDRRLIFIHRMMSFATEAQQEVFVMQDSEVISESDAILRRMRANT